MNNVQSVADMKESAKANYYNDSFSEAILDLDEVIKSNPKDKDALYNRSLCKRINNDHEGSIEDCNTILKLDKKYVKAWLNRGITHVQKGNLKQGSEDWKHAEDLDPNIRICLYQN